MHDVRQPDEGLDIRWCVDGHVLDVEGLDDGCFPMKPFLRLSATATTIGRSDLHQGSSGTLLVHLAIVTYVVAVGLLYHLDLALAMQPHEAHKFPEVQGAAVILVKPTQQANYLVHLCGVPQVAHDIAQLDDIDVPAAIHVELVKSDPDLLQLLRRETVRLVQDLHEVHEGIIVQIALLGLVPITLRLRFLDHAIDGELGQGDTEIGEHRLQLLEVDGSAAVQVRLGEGLFVALELLVPQPPRPHQPLGEVETQWAGAALADALGQVDQLFRELPGVRGEGRAEKISEEIPQFVRGQNRAAHSGKGCAHLVAGSQRLFEGVREPLHLVAREALGMPVEMH
mmetsp:Transcript_136700/g.437291  ORF Transcript_136700/g.437291 Transcript_136700/m.437291 type:complete len:340 (+) Transcript_136700:783-1802(+)